MSFELAPKTCAGFFTLFVLTDAKRRRFLN